MKALEMRLAKLATVDERVRLLMTHSGVGLINALALVHTLGGCGASDERKKLSPL
jgi:hypothetical protein